MSQPSLLSHIGALLMPITMTVLIPLWLLRDYQGDPLPDTPLHLAGIILVLAGIGLFVSTLKLFITIGKGTLAPWKATTKMVITGPYRYCRNPMISGVFFVILGEALYFDSLSLGTWAGIFFLANTAYFALKEEPDLEKKFGKDYVEYKRSVGRWIPKLSPYKKGR